MSEPQDTNEAACGRSDSTAVLERRVFHTYEVVTPFVYTKIPDVLFDGFAVLQALDEKAKARTSPENVSDVLDSVVRLMRSNNKCAS